MENEKQKKLEEAEGGVQAGGEGEQNRKTLLPGLSLLVNPREALSLTCLLWGHRDAKVAVTEDEGG